MENQYKLALLIDAENISQKYIKLMMDEIGEYGIATYKRVYGDFANPSVSAWKNNLIDYAMTPIFQFNYTKGKNASDSAMVIDAMDILYSGNVNGFCLVTSDSDFTKLAIRLREAGMFVVGMGERKTPSSLVAACDTFKYLDLLYCEEENIQKTSPEKDDTYKEDNSVVEDNLSKDEEPIIIPDKNVVGTEITSIIEMFSDEDGWAFLGVIGNQLAKRIPGFDPRNYGFKKLKSFIESYDCYEIRDIINPKNELLKQVYVKMK